MYNLVDARQLGEDIKIEEIDSGRDVTIQPGCSKSTNDNELCKLQNLSTNMRRIICDVLLMTAAENGPVNSLQNL